MTAFIEKQDTMAHKDVIAGIYWFKNGIQLRDALDTVIAEDRKSKGEYYLVDAYKVMLEQGAKIKTKETIFWLDAGKPDYMLSTNQRLLGLGYGTEDAIDRSYGEDFTVIPPVYLDESAQIENCVLGPYVSIGPDAVLKNCIIHNSIVDAGANIENAILEDSLIGENTKVKGTHKKLFIGDNSKVELG
ncbi:MAG: hypothetical protein GY943_20905 [Chloroflexi bacterium]|nr:hypothetical protein [Chloroflexota bacterium]